MLNSTDVPAVPSFEVPTLYPLNTRLSEALPGKLNRRGKFTKKHISNDDLNY